MACLMPIPTGASRVATIPAIHSEAELYRQGKAAGLSPEIDLRRRPGPALAKSQRLRTTVGELVGEFRLQQMVRRTPLRSARRRTTRESKRCGPNSRRPSPEAPSGAHEVGRAHTPKTSRRFSIPISRYNARKSEIVSMEISGRSDNNFAFAAQRRKPLDGQGPKSGSPGSCRGRSGKRNKDRCLIVGYIRSAQRTGKN